MYNKLKCFGLILTMLVVSACAKVDSQPSPVPPTKQQAGQPVTQVPITAKVTDVNAQVIRVFRGPSGQREGDLVLFNYFDVQMGYWYHCTAWGTDLTCEPISVDGSNIKY